MDAKAKVEEIRAERDEARIRLAKEQAEHTFEAEKKMAIMEKNHNRLHLASIVALNGVAKTHSCI